MAGARAVQESVLQAFPDAEVSASVVWIQMPGFEDNEKSARRIAATFDDSRVKHFFDPFPVHRAGEAFAEGRVSRGPAWDIYFFYERGAEWGKRLPEPAEWMHQLSGGIRADGKRFRTGNELVKQLRETMHHMVESDRQRSDE